MVLKKDLGSIPITDMKVLLVGVDTEFGIYEFYRSMMKKPTYDKVRFAKTGQNLKPKPNPQKPKPKPLPTQSPKPSPFRQNSDRW